MVWNAVLVKAGMQGTVPKVGALALRLRSSGIPTMHTTHADQWREHRGDKMKQVRLPLPRQMPTGGTHALLCDYTNCTGSFMEVHSSHSTEGRLFEASLRA